MPETLPPDREVGGEQGGQGVSPIDLTYLSTNFSTMYSK